MTNLRNEAVINRQTAAWARNEAMYRLQHAHDTVEEVVIEEDKPKFYENLNETVHHLFLVDTSITFTQVENSHYMQVVTKKHRTPAKYESMVVAGARRYYKILRSNGASTECLCSTWDEGRCVTCGKIHY